MADVWDLYSRLGDADRSALTHGQRRLLAVCDLRQEVNSGGFDSYFRYWGGDSAAEALLALPDMLGQDWADLLREAMELLGVPYPAECDDRAARIDAGNLDARLHQIDERFFALEGSTDADARLNAYVDSDFS